MPARANGDLVNSQFGVFYSNILSLTPTFCKVSIEKYSKTPTFSGRQHFYSYFQNPSEDPGKDQGQKYSFGKWCIRSERSVCQIEHCSSYSLQALTEPPHEKTGLCHMQTTKAQISLRICTFVVRRLDSIISLVSISEISSH